MLNHGSNDEPPDQATTLAGSAGLAALATSADQAQDTRLKVYLSTGLGFNKWGKTYMDQVLVPKLLEAGMDPINPWYLVNSEEKERVFSMPTGPERDLAEKALRTKVAASNRIGIDMCHVLIAVLDGLNLNPGTIAELSYAVGKGKVVFAWRANTLEFADEKAPLNLQVEYFIEHSGGQMVTDLDELIALAQKFRHQYLG